MSPPDLLEVADDLLDGLKESHWRSAVSRAYFAAFHEARRLMRHCGFVVPKGEQSHAFLWLRLCNCAHPDLAHAGAELNDLRTQRNWADYHFDHPLDQSAAADYVQPAQTLVARAIVLPPGTPARPRVEGPGLSESPATGRNGEILDILVSIARG